jgi:hypoxanthine phosphoribosyltransferase
MFLRSLTLLFLCTFSTSYGADTLTPLISREEIQAKVKDVAQIIGRDYQDKNLVIVSVMKSAICVTADLMRELHVPFTLHCMRASSYGQNGKKSGELILKDIEDLDIASKDVIVVDDIFDTGKTMMKIVEVLKLKNPSSLKTLVLLAKNVSRQTPYRPDYVLFDIEDEFVVGYGMDYKEFYRGLPGIFIISTL